MLLAPCSWGQIQTWSNTFRPGNNHKSQLFYSSSSPEQFISERLDGSFSKFGGFSSNFTSSSARVTLQRARTSRCESTDDSLDELMQEGAVGARMSTSTTSPLLSAINNNLRRRESSRLPRKSLLFLFFSRVPMYFYSSTIDKYR